MNRDAVIAAFLQAQGYAPEDARPLAQDASFRRYSRLKGGAVLMDAPPPDDIRPFLHIAAHLSALGLSVPVILAADPAHGLMIEEDLGDDLFSVIMTDANAETLLAAAVDALVVMQRAAPPTGLPAWGPAAMTETALGTFADWWWPATHGAPIPDEARRDVANALTAMLEPLEHGPRTMVHRDFFAGNLLWLPHRTEARRAGIIDFQTAALGHPAYDLVSLLQDARRDMRAEWESFAIARYLAARPELDPVAFHSAYAACAAQRHLRVACQWVRLAQRDHRPHYLTFGPRTWSLLTRALNQPGASPLAIVLNRWVPEQQRRNPPRLSTPGSK